MAGKLSGGAIESNTITTDQLTSALNDTISSGGGPKVTSFVYPDDDTAANTIGGQTVYILGSGFDSNVTVYINGSAVPSVTYINSGNVQITTPNLASGTYPVYVINPDDGATAIVAPGITVSPEPVWVTSATLPTFTLNSPVSQQLNATSTSSNTTVTYSLKSGSSLPNNLTIAANGLLSGTITSPPNTATTYTFTALAKDAENQTSERTFSMTGYALTATGGTVSNISGYRVHTFDATGSLVVTGSGPVEYFLIGGGGGGGAGQYQGGGGGAGGLVEGSVVLYQNTYTVTVGGGGAAQTGTGIQGSNTSISGNGITTIVGIGGGGGAGEFPSGGGAAPGNGGSGGGGSHGGATMNGGTALQSTSASGGYGNNGGTGHSTTGNYVGAGGGGAGAVGGDATSSTAGSGGAGRATSISGSSVTYGGGGGGSRRGGPSAAGGSGGGGTGNSTGGTPNTGGGGGYAFSGGSGKLIIRYPI